MSNKNVLASTTPVEIASPTTKKRQRFLVLPVGKETLTLLGICGKVKQAKGTCEEVALTVNAQFAKDQPRRTPWDLNKAYNSVRALQEQVKMDCRTKLMDVKRRITAEEITPEEGKKEEEEILKHGKKILYHLDIPRSHGRGKSSSTHDLQTLAAALPTPVGADIDLDDLRNQLFNEAE